jgi:putative holliday junction resolvase
MPNNNTQTLLGFDFGMRRIGIAIGNTVTNTAQPLIIIQAQDGIPDWNEINNLINQWAITALVVGMPYNIDGEFQEITHAAKKFANRLKQKFKLPVHLIDERYTTKIAKSASRKDKGVDSIAASILLQSWLNEANS